MTIATDTTPTLEQWDVGVMEHEEAARIVAAFLAAITGPVRFERTGNLSPRHPGLWLVAGGHRTPVFSSLTGCGQVALEAVVHAHRQGW